MSDAVDDRELVARLRELDGDVPLTELRSQAEKAPEGGLVLNRDKFIALLDRIEAAEQRLADAGEAFENIASRMTKTMPLSDVRQYAASRAAWVRSFLQHKAAP